MLKKKGKEKVKTKGTHAWDDPIMKKSMPTLYDYLSQISFPDGPARKTATLKIFTQDGRVKVFINDYEEEQSICVSADTWEGLWKAVEGVLSDPDAEWRDLPDWEKKKKK